MQLMVFFGAIFPSGANFLPCWCILVQIFYGTGVMVRLAETGDILYSLATRYNYIVSGTTSQFRDRSSSHISSLRISSSANVRPHYFVLAILCLAYIRLCRCSSR